MNSKVVYGQTADPVLAFKWDALLVESSNVFDKPGKPVSSTVDHKINLLDLSAVLYCLRLYHISEYGLKAIKLTIKKYLDKAWIWPNKSPYRAPVVVICKKSGELYIIIEY